MSGELHIMDDGFEQELLSLPTPLAFIDFETVNARFIIPNTTLTQSVPCQWSSHMLYAHGTDWDSNIAHDEFLWMGDIGWNPIYAFVESLYYATEEAATILIYSNYENTCLKACIEMARHDMDAYEWGELPEDYTVVNAAGEKVPLMDIAPYIEGWCSSMMARFFDMLGSTKNGVRYWLQSPEFHGSNSIKYVFPVASKEYSRSSELLALYGIPANGYEGFREAGQIAKGDECMTLYQAALNRPPREGVDRNEPGQAPFDPEIARQCLIYCCLDTLSMVVIYLAVIEATERWREEAENSFAEYALFDDDPDYPYHSVYFDADNQVFYKTCDIDLEYPYPYDTYLELVSEEELMNRNIRDYYSIVCPKCRKIANRGYDR